MYVMFNSPSLFLPIRFCTPLPSVLYLIFPTVNFFLPLILLPPLSQFSSAHVTSWTYKSPYQNISYEAERWEWLEEQCDKSPTPSHYPFPSLPFLSPQSLPHSILSPSNPPPLPTISFSLSLLICQPRLASLFTWVFAFLLSLTRLQFSPFPYSLGLDETIDTLSVISSCQVSSWGKYYDPLYHLRFWIFFFFWH